MAQISSAITDQGGLIVALDVFLGKDPSNWGCTLKVSDLSQDKLLKAVEPLVIKVEDIREV